MSLLEDSSVPAATNESNTTTTSKLNDDIRIDECIVSLLEDTHKVKLLYAQIYGTFLVWVGDPKSPVMNNLSLALGKNSTDLLAKSITSGNSTSGMEGVNAEMAAKLSTKFNGGRPVYVAYNYTPVATSPPLKLEVDRALISFVKSCRGITGQTPSSS